MGAAILAAGKGLRFGSDKTTVHLAGKQLWQWSYDTFKAHPQVHEVICVAGDNIDEIRENSGCRVILGGATRQESSAIGFNELAQNCDIVLIHDAARPFVDAATISRVIEGISEAGAAAPVVPLVDTIRDQSQNGAILIRENLVAMQTPQGATVEVFRNAFHRASGAETDEISLFQRVGQNWKPVDGAPGNFKVTVPEDYVRAMGALRPVFRTGFGYDIHRFSGDRDRKLYLCGIEFPGAQALEGHSDADVVLHAVTDALLGGAALGDIGQHFPPSESQWKNVRSHVFVEKALGLLKNHAWRIENVDIAVAAEYPKLMPESQKMRAYLAELCGIDCDQVSLKATTNEGLGAIGRGEGIACWAVASLSRIQLA